MANSNTNSKAILKNRQTYSLWFAQLQWRALEDGVWELVNPDGPDAPAFNTSPLSPPPTVQQLIEQSDQRRGDQHTIAVAAWERADHATRGNRPAAAVPTTFDEVQMEHAARMQDYIVASHLHKERLQQYRSFSNWLPTTIDSEIWASTISALRAVRLGGPFRSSSTTPLTLLQRSIEELETPNHASLQDITRYLKRWFAPSSSSTEHNLAHALLGF
jgi:hypothetical protein